MSAPVARGCLSALEIGRQLDRELHHELSRAKHNRRQVFLELYSGAGIITKYIKSRGFGCLAFDIAHGSHHDLLNTVVHKRIMGWIQSGVVRGIWLGTVCSSWSRARRGPLHSNWGPLRDDEHIWGLPNMSDRDCEKILLGNRTACNSASIIKCCERLSVPCILENPVASRLWQCPPIKASLTSQAAASATCDQCQFGAPWRKRTRIAGWHCNVHEFDKRCTGRQSICSRTGKHHVILSGPDPSSSKPFPAQAQMYTDQFGKIGADALIVGSDALQMQRLMQVGGGVRHSAK